MTSTIPPPLDEPLSTFFAIERKPREEIGDVVAAVLRAAKDCGVLFRRLEVLDTLTLGVTSYTRMRTELVNPFSILDKLYAGGRNVICSMQGGEYVVRMVGGRMGKISNIIMHATPRLGQSRMFRGTKFKYWERQFETPKPA
jgi:hypothetical protein